MLQLMNGVSPGTSLCSDVLDTNSEPGDPLHDQSLLQELFYKHSVGVKVFMGLETISFLLFISDVI